MNEALDPLSQIAELEIADVQAAKERYPDFVRRWRELSPKDVRRFRQDKKLLALDDDKIRADVTAWERYTELQAAMIDPRRIEAAQAFALQQQQELKAHFVKTISEKIQTLTLEELANFCASAQTAKADDVNPLAYRDMPCHFLVDSIHESQAASDRIWSGDSRENSERLTEIQILKNKFPHIFTAD